MVLKNLFTGNSGEIDTENRLMDMGSGEERVRCMESVTRKLIFIIFLIICFYLKDNCFIELCCFLSNLNMNQP